MPLTDGLWWDEHGAGPALLLLHAGIADSRMWEPQLQAFATDHRVLRFDARGFGRSASPAGPFRPLDDALAVLDAAGAETALLVGSSMGGATAIDLAIAAPERVQALIAVGIGPHGGEPDAALRAGWDEVSAVWESGDQERAIDLDTAMWIRDPAVFAQVRPWNAAIAARDEDLSSEVRLDPPAIGRLGEIRCPVLAICGDSDQPAMLAGSRLLAAGVPDGRFVVMKGCSHLPNLDQPGEFARIVVAFESRF